MFEKITGYICTNSGFGSICLSVYLFVCNEYLTRLLLCENRIKLARTGTF